MKKLLFLFFIVLISSSVIAQTNTFPASGKVGIGTSSPNNKLEVDGNVNLNNFYGYSDILNRGYYVYKNGTTAYGMKLQYTSGQFGTMVFGPNQSNRFISFGKVGSQLVDGEMLEYMRIDLDNGKVGIGTKNPQETISITGPGAMLGIYDTNSASKANNRMGRYSSSFVIQNDFSGGWKDNIILHDNGSVGIGTRNPAYKLDVIGTIRAQELKVDMQGADFVFEDDYQLRSLEEVESFVQVNKHLPDVAPAKEMQENGVNQSEMNQKFLQKIEELTLYVIELNKKVAEQQKEIEVLKGN